MISLIITTAPGREENLDACLQSIANQTIKPTEVIVTDDGENGGVIAKKWASVLPLRYLSRPNDRCVSRSRNLAVAKATQDYLVFIDGDILLNPDGLKAYKKHFQDLPNALLNGYFGNYFTYVSPSVFDKSREVNYIDKRFEACLTDRFHPVLQLLLEPAFFCWSGNMGISRKNYHRIGGFNEAFTGWGSEDVDFGLRAIDANIDIHFCIDSWGEHQVHCRKGNYHKKTALEEQRTNKLFTPPHPAIKYQVRVMGEAFHIKDFHRQLVSFYAQQDPEITPALKNKLMKANAVLVSRFNADQTLLELGCAFEKP